MGLPIDYRETTSCSSIMLENTYRLYSFHQESQNVSIKSFGRTLAVFIFKMLKMWFFMHCQFKESGASSLHWVIMHCQFTVFKLLEQKEFWFFFQFKQATLSEAICIPSWQFFGSFGWKEWRVFQNKKASLILVAIKTQTVIISRGLNVPFCSYKCLLYSDQIHSKTR